MKTTIKSGIIATIIALNLYSATAQTPVQWTRTLRLEGKWKGPVTLKLGTQTFQITYRTDFKKAISGNALTMIEGFNDPALGELKGANLIGLNVSDGMIHWSSVDNFGTAHEHIGTWITSTHFHMEHSSPQGAQTFTELIDLKLISNNHKVEISLVAKLDADTIETLNGTLTRQHHRTASPGIIPDNDEDEINIYPNPSDGNINIESPAIIDEVKIINESGEIIYQSMPKDVDFSMQLEKNGVYLVQVTSDKKTIVKKVIVEN